MSSAGRSGNAPQTVVDLHGPARADTAIARRMVGEETMRGLNLKGFYETCGSDAPHPDPILFLAFQPFFLGFGPAINLV